MGFWPYSCEPCGRRFHAARRYPPARRARSKPAPRPKSAGQANGVEMAFRNDPVRPLAKVVIQADDQVQLDQILMALHRAVSHYAQPAREYSSSGTR